MMNYSLLWLCLLKLKTCRAIFMYFSTSLLIPGQYIDLHARHFVFLIPICLICSCSSACFCNVSDITTNLPFRMPPSITAIFSQPVQFSLRFCAMWSLFSGHPLMICSFSCGKWLSCGCFLLQFTYHHAFGNVCSCFYGVNAYLHTSYFFIFCFLCGFIWIASLLWRDLDQVYILLTLYWCVLKRIHCGLCDNVATSFLNISTGGLWSVIILTSLVKQ